MYCLEFSSEAEAASALEPHNLWMRGFKTDDAEEPDSFNPCYVVLVPPSRVKTGKTISVTDEDGNTALVDETVPKQHFLLNIAGLELPESLHPFCVVPASPRVVIAGDEIVKDVSRPSKI